jgi:hypothetical protein
MTNSRRKKNSYNGWKNRETWNVVLWVMNDEGTYKEMRRAVRSGDAPMTADDAQEFVEEIFPDGTPDMKDVATEVAYKRVDWEAVADAFNEEWEGERETNGLRRGIINSRKKGGGFPWGVWKRVDPGKSGGRLEWATLACLSFPANANRLRLTSAQINEVHREMRRRGFAVPMNPETKDHGEYIVISDLDTDEEVFHLDGYPEDECPLDDPNFSEDYYASGPRQPNGLRRVFDPPPPPPPPRPTYTTPQKMKLRYLRSGVYLPAWNVKVHRRGVFDADEIRKHFKCSQEKAEKAVEWAWDSTQEQWWERAQESAKYHLGGLHSKIKVESDGRSGGWCILNGLPEIYDKTDPIEDTFDEETLKGLAEFEKDILSEMNFYLDDRDGLEELIDVNGWCEP